MPLYRILIVVALILVGGCTPNGDSGSLKLKSEVPVSVHGVNYTADPFQFVIVDPNDPANTAGGEHIGPFAAGGIMCCFNLPGKWSPGIKVQVHASYWLPKNASGELPEVSKVYTVDVPPYAAGKAGELWVLRNSAGTIEVISSDLQPDHPEWPGKVKGWPVPSKEYMRERWELQRKLAEDSVNNVRTLISDLESRPIEERRSAWEFDSQYHPAEIAKFRGPEDSAYMHYLENKYKQSLLDSEAHLESIKKEKP